MVMFCVVYWLCQDSWKERKLMGCLQLFEIITSSRHFWPGNPLLYVTCTFNSDLLPNAQLQPGCQQQIQPRTAMKCLHYLGFYPPSHKKSIYIDEHEHDDVVEYQKLYLRKLDILSSTHLPPPTCEDGLIAVQTSKHLVL